MIIQFTNSGTQPVTLGTFNLSGDADFLLTGPSRIPASSLPPEATCSIEVTFRP